MSLILIIGIRACIRRNKLKKALKLVKYENASDNDGEELLHWKARNAVKDADLFNETDDFDDHDVVNEVITVTYPILNSNYS